MGKRQLDADGFVAEALKAFDEAVSLMEIEVPEVGRSLIQGWLGFFTAWKGRRVAGFDEPRELAAKLIADSFAAALVPGLCGACKGVDLGSGNGWPGLALKALELCGHVSLLDSRAGACEFLRGFVESTRLSGVEVLQERAEQAGQDEGFRERYTLAVSRAMAAPGIALELCSGLVAPGGKVVLWVGPEQEVPRSGPGLDAIGLKLKTEIPYTLPWDMGSRLLAVYNKVQPLDRKYPRRYAAIRKKPLI